MPDLPLVPDRVQVRPRNWWARAAAVGVAAGLLSGLFGVGGGIVMVPLLVGFFALDQQATGVRPFLRW